MLLKRFPNKEIDAKEIAIANGIVDSKKKKNKMMLNFVSKLLLKQGSFLLSVFLLLLLFLFLPAVLGTFDIRFAQ